MASPFEEAPAKKATKSPFEESPTKQEAKSPFSEDTSTNIISPFAVDSPPPAPEAPGLFSRIVNAPSNALDAVAGGAMWGVGKLFAPFPGVKGIDERAAQAVKDIANPIQEKPGQVVFLTEEQKNQINAANNDRPVGSMDEPTATIAPYKTLIKSPTGAGGVYAQMPPAEPDKFAPESIGTAIERTAGDAAIPAFAALAGNTEANLSPFGVVSAPLRMIPAVGKIAAEALGAESLLGAGLKGGIRGVVAGAGKLGEMPKVQETLQNAQEYAFTKHPKLYGIYHKFIYPKALTYIDGVMANAIPAAQSDVIDIGLKALNKPPLEAQKIFSTMRDASDEEYRFIFGMHKEVMKSPEWKPLMGADESLHPLVEGFDNRRTGMEYVLRTIPNDTRYALERAHAESRVLPTFEKEMGVDTQSFRGNSPIKGMTKKVLKGKVVNKTTGNIIDKTKGIPESILKKVESSAVFTKQNATQVENWMNFVNEKDAVKAIPKDLGDWLAQMPEEQYNNLRNSFADLKSEMPDMNYIDEKGIAIKDALKKKLTIPFQRTDAAQMENYMDYISHKERAEAVPRDLNEWAASVPKDIRELVSARAKLMGIPLLGPESKAFAEEIWARKMDIQSKLLKAKMASPHAFSVTGGTFAPAYYGDHPLSLGPLMEGGRIGSKADLSELAPKTLHTTEARVKRGEIENLAYNVMRSESLGRWDAIVGEWAQSVAENPTLAATAEQVGLNPRKYIGWQTTPKKGYGMLDNMYVHPSVREEMKGMWMDADTTLGGVMSVIARGMHRFKRGVTVLNIPTHVGNNISNPIQVDMKDIPVTPDRIEAAVEDFLGGNTERFKEAVKLGHISPLFMRGREVRELLRSATLEADTSDNGMSFAIDKFLKTLALGEGKGSMATIPDRAYQGSEEFWKFYTYKTAMEEGIPTMGVAAGDMRGASRLADEAVFNYGNVPVGVKEIRSGPLGAFVTPFITYTWKATPLAVETLLNRPWKYLKWKAFFESYNAAARKVAGISEDDWNNYQQAKIDSAGSEIEKLFVSLQPEMIMPFKGPGGRIMVMGAARFTPWGAAIDPRGMGLAGPVTSALFPGKMGTRSAYDAGTPATLEGVDGPEVSPSPFARKAGSVVKQLMPLLPGGATGAKLATNVLGLLPGNQSFDNLGAAQNPQTWLREALGVKTYQGGKMNPMPIPMAQRIAQMTTGSIRPVSAEDLNNAAMRQKYGEKLAFNDAIKTQKTGQVLADMANVPPINAQPWKGNAYSPYTGQVSPIKKALAGAL